MCLAYSKLDLAAVAMWGKETQQESKGHNRQDRVFSKLNAFLKTEHSNNKLFTVSTNGATFGMLHEGGMP